jgi:hypothetical protein
MVNIATSADGFVARTDGNLIGWTERPAPKGFYGLPKFRAPSIQDFWLQDLRTECEDGHEGQRR